MDEDLFRRLAAEIGAIKFIGEIMLGNYFACLDQAVQDNFADRIVEAARRIDHLEATSYEAAEELADVAVRTHDVIDRLVKSAMARARS